MRTTTLTALALFSLFAVACRVSPPGAPRPQIVGPAAPLQDPMNVIARHEDARSDGDGLLQTLALRAEARTRERACIALGRLSLDEHGKSVSEALAAALEDDVPAVRAAAAFALGQRGDRASAKPLLAAWNDPDAAVRARIVEAASKIDDAQLRRSCLDALSDEDPLVRAEAALAPMRIVGEAPVAEAALIDLLERARRATPNVQGDVAWRALFALARRKCVAARPTFAAYAGSKDARERIFALQGLVSAGPDEAGKAALVTALSDPDWRAAYEAATALGRHVDANALEALDLAARHASAHVRAAAVEALGAYSVAREPASTLAERATLDPSANVRAAALVALAKLRGDAYAPDVDLKRLEKDPIVRAGAARAAAELSPRLAVVELIAFTDDRDLRVAGIAIEGLGKHPTPESLARLRALLASEDNGLRLAAVDALKAHASAADVAVLSKAFESSRGEIAPEIAASVLDAAARIASPDAQALLRRGLEHDDAFVRSKARALLLKADPSARLPARKASNGSARLDDPPRWSSNPKVEVVTTRGTLVFELFPDEAPRHVENFTALVARKHYDGLVFHRVVPDFVVQGGDVRGDGNGGTTFDGKPLRGEFGPRKYVRGSLGMPRNDDPDSGGSQIFVTHRETPHLDGRYTLFGELRDGVEVLDALEVGDRIVSARVLDDGR